MSPLTDYVAHFIERQRQRELEQRIQQLNALRDHRRAATADRRPRGVIKAQPPVTTRRAAAGGCE